MRRTLTALTAAVFASALALPAFAQVGVPSDATESNSTSSTSESVNHEYHAVAPAPMTNSVETNKREYRSESSNEVTAPVAPSEQVQRRVENKVTTRTTTSVVPPPLVEESTTSRTVTDRSDSTTR